MYVQVHLREPSGSNLKAHILGMNMETWRGHHRSQDGLEQNNWDPRSREVQGSSTNYRKSVSH